MRLVAIRWLRDGVPTIDREDCPGHEGGRVAGEVDDRRPQFLRQGVAPLGSQIHPPWRVLGVIDRCDARLDVSGSYRIDADAHIRPFDRKASRQLMNGRLRCVVGRLLLRSVDRKRRLD